MRFYFCSCLLFWWCDDYWWGKYCWSGSTLFLRASVCKFFFLYFYWFLSYCWWWGRYCWSAGQLHNLCKWISVLIAVSLPFLLFYHLGDDEESIIGAQVNAPFLWVGSHALPLWTQLKFVTAHHRRTVYIWEVCIVL